MKYAYSIMNWFLLHLIIHWPCRNCPHAKISHAEMATPNWPSLNCLFRRNDAKINSQNWIRGVRRGTCTKLACITSAEGLRYFWVKFEVIKKLNKGRDSYSRYSEDFRWHRHDGRLRMTHWCQLFWSLRLKSYREARVKYTKRAVVRRWILLLWLLTCTRKDATNTMCIRCPILVWKMISSARKTLHFQQVDILAITPNDVCNQCDQPLKT